MRATRPVVGSATPSWRLSNQTQAWERPAVSRVSRRPTYPTVPRLSVSRGEDVLERGGSGARLRFPEDAANGTRPDRIPQWLVQAAERHRTGPTDSRVGSDSLEAGEGPGGKRYASLLERE